MANQDRRSHAPSKPKRGKPFRDPRENRKFARSQDENTDRREPRHSDKPQPGKPTRSQRSGPKPRYSQEDKTDRFERRYPSQPKLGKPRRSLDTRDTKDTTTSRKPISFKKPVPRESRETQRLEPMSTDATSLTNTEEESDLLYGRHPVLAALEKPAPAEPGLDYSPTALRFSLSLLTLPS
jgi:hypothetical protein